VQFNATRRNSLKKVVPGNTKFVFSTFLFSLASFSCRPSNNQHLQQDKQQCRLLKSPSEAVERLTWAGPVKITKNAMRGIYASTDAITIALWLATSYAIKDYYFY
jgi:hypothetical protein